MAAGLLTAVIGGGLAVIGSVITVGTTIANLLTQLPIWVSYIFFLSIIGVDAFIVGGTTEALLGESYTFTEILLLPINLVFGTSFDAMFLFILLVLIGFIWIMFKAIILILPFAIEAAR